MKMNWHAKHLDWNCIRNKHLFFWHLFAFIGTFWNNKNEIRTVNYINRITKTWQKKLNKWQLKSIYVRMFHFLFLRINIPCITICFTISIILIKLWRESYIRGVIIIYHLMIVLYIKTTPRPKIRTLRHKLSFFRSMFLTFF